MTSKVYTISLPEQLSNFIQDNPELSLSKITQVAIQRIIEDHKFSETELIRSEKARQKLQEELMKATEFITIKGMWDDYVKIN